MSTKTHCVLGTTLHRSVPWWKWFEIAGVVGLVLLAAALLVGLLVPPLAIAVVVHIACDFTLQTEETSRRKCERGRHLLVHALIAGAFPLLLATISSDVSPDVVLVCTAVGATTHYITDYMNKFGLSDPWGVVIDQALHLVTISGLVLVVC